MSRGSLEAEWLRLTRVDLPALAHTRDWPVSNDHCFQRILLDQACGGCWYDTITGRPAYKCASDAVLKRAVSLGHAVIAGQIDLAALDCQSLTWRGKVSPSRSRPAIR